ncbi:unnamed protein product, partial [Linum tenue]
MEKLSWKFVMKRKRTRLRASGFKRRLIRIRTREKRSIKQER